MIERCAIGNDSDRRAQGIIQVRALDGDHRVAPRQREACEIAKEIWQPRELGASLVDGSAVVERLQPVQLLQMCLERVGEPIDQPRARTNVHVAPCAAIEGGPRAFHRAIDIFRGRIRNARDDVAGGGIANIEHLTAAGFDFAAIDKVAVDLDLGWFGGNIQTSLPSGSCSNENGLKSPGFDLSLWGRRATLAVRQAPANRSRKTGLDQLLAKGTVNAAQSGQG